MQDRSAERDMVAERLAEDLVGPRDEAEVLESRPSDVYLTGILWPSRTVMSGEDDERLAAGGSRSRDDSGDEDDEIGTRSIHKPSVAGISFSAFSHKTPQVQVVCTFAMYRVETKDDARVWARRPYRVEIPNLELSVGPSHRVQLEQFDGEVSGVSLNVRCVAVESAVLVTLTLVNDMSAERKRDKIEEASLFQTRLYVEPCDGTSLVPKPDRRSAPLPSHGNGGGKAVQVSDEESGQLLYRNTAEFAVGHVCSAEWGASRQWAEFRPCACHVATTWLPSSIVEGFDPNGHGVFAELGTEEPHGFDPMAAEDLARADGETLAGGLDAFCEAYESWIALQKNRLDDPKDVPPHFRYVAEAHLARCGKALERMRSGTKAIRDDERTRRAFQLANLAMHLQHAWALPGDGGNRLRWRPFQLGFLLLSIPSAVDREHDDRGIMDLLWFPTGGGKTEAYLALIACVAVYRRLSDDSADHCGVCALMRYTLRLLTTQQFARAAAMIIALEAIRTNRVPVPDGMVLRGTEPLSIGLWVGGDATPNKRAAAFESVRKRSLDVASPEQLACCPACGEQLKWSMESVQSDVRVECVNEQCVVYGDLPVYTVDEDVYDNRPTLLIGTVDKFAQIARQKRTNGLFGITGGTPPDLVIQDELHLISGPLGTIAGAYEAAFDLLFAARGSRAKIIGSTATIRSAPEQVRALFDRDAFQFPPPAIDHDDSGFAVRDARPGATGRRYLGVTTSGRSAKFTLQAVAGSLMQSALGAFDEDTRRDAYWTLVGYFNSLRELGGALVLMQDDVSDSISLYADARGEAARPPGNIEELTSRRTQQEIREMLDILSVEAGDTGAVDAVLATNMVSVGVDISRLGLMLVHGQPKTTAEYIQATSRVGRGDVSGLVVSILNNAKARDRSHFETFCSWHQTLYRDVEATSVTPFAPRARDRALHAALVVAVRHLVPDMLDSPELDEDTEDRARVLIDKIVARAKRIDPDERAVQRELEKRLDGWLARVPSRYWDDYKPSVSLLQSAERAAARHALGRDVGSAWPTLNSMRSVEAGTPFRMVPGLKGERDVGEQ